MGAPCRRAKGELTEKDQGQNVVVQLQEVGLLEPWEHLASCYINHIFHCQLVWKTKSRKEERGRRGRRRRRRGGELVRSENGSLQLRLVAPSLMRMSSTF